MKGEVASVEKVRFVVVCDGAAGSIKRKLRKAPAQFITTYQTFHKGTIDIVPHFFFAFLHPELSEYDAWFNAKDDYLIFGVAVKDTALIGHYHAVFMDFMRGKFGARVGEPVQSEKWVMPQIVSGCPVDYGEGRVLFAGETAGFLNPMGEGISAGLESGHAAAVAVLGMDG